MEFCRYTDAGSNETVAIVGDSHAHSAYFGIAKLGLELGYNTVLLGHFMTGVEHVNKARAKEVSVIFDVLNGKKDIKKVFVSVMWSARLDRLSKKIEDHHGYLQSWVDKLRAYGKDVYILNDNPMLPKNPAAYVPRPFSSDKRSTFPSVTKADVLKNNEYALEILAKIHNATIIDVLGPMCPDAACLVFTKEGLPLYRDSNHLSLVGSEFQAEHILRPYLSDRKGE